MTTVTTLAPSRTRRRPRSLRWLAITAAAVVLVLALGTTGAGWYFASQLLTVDHTASYPVAVRSVTGSSVTLSRDAKSERPIQYGLTWAGGHAVLDATVRVSGDKVIRTVKKVTRGSLRAGVHAYMDTYVFGPDPKSGRGLDFQTVTVRGELGDLPAWYVQPATDTPQSTWVIAVHGRTGDRSEALRILPTLGALGLPTLAITYRNDVEAPASPDGYYHLGDTESRDVAAAVTYARAHGATGVVLYGWSMGGAAVMTALGRLTAADRAFVHGLVLDSPATDWNATLELQADQRDLPAALTWTAKRLVEQRADLSLDVLDQARTVASLRVPTLMFVDTSDTTVPPEPSMELARAQPNLITLVTTRGGDHTASWNVDPDRYETAVRSFLTARKAN